MKMDDKKETQKEPETKEVPTPPKEEGDKPKAISPIDAANNAAERMEKANLKHEELLKKSEELEAKKILGGTTEAGVQIPKQEETPAEYAKRVMGGDETLNQ